jgi:hypothetical protein
MESAKCYAATPANLSRVAKHADPTASVLQAFDAVASAKLAKGVRPTRQCGPVLVSCEK